MLKKILCGATLLCAATFSHAATIVLTDTVALQTSNFSSGLTFAQFDTLGGTRVLQSVSFSIDGSILGDALVESTDKKNSTLVTTISAQLKLTDVLNNVLVVTIPTMSNTFNASAYDGNTDFAGTSGISYNGLTASAFNSETYTDAVTLAMFSGTGTSNFTFGAEALSEVTGAGNLVSSFSTQASGIINVIYTYKDDTSTVVSSPTHIALLGFGLLAFAGFRKARK